MQCDCGHDTKVVDSRADEVRNTIVRRRECLRCSERFTTVEQRHVVELPKKNRKRKGLKIVN